MLPIPLNLPTLPGVHHQALALLARDADADELAEIVRADPALAASVLRMANSASSMPVVPVTSVDTAIVRLGMEQLHRVVAAAVLRYSFSSMRTSLVDGTEMWRHLTVTAMLAEHLVPRALVRSAFTAGILHDIGRLTMIDVQPERYSRVVRMAWDGVPTAEAESKMFGVDHCEWGADVAAHWRLGPDLVDVIAAHHEGGGPLADAVREARKISSALGVGDGVVHGAPPELDPESPEGKVVALFGGKEQLDQRVNSFQRALAAA
jgi:putative nucleotidyltransferase with HDIG domain